ncbi:MAG: acyltransferase [Rhodospirillaceae bacterium]|nr:acyltransferase [Rhodospirillaceae bacterium]
MAYYASTPRITCLDGLRGVAAITVLAYHFLLAFTPAPFEDQARTGITLLDLPFAVLWNGDFAVAVFFVLSGFVLAASSPRTVREAPMMLSLRYLRLAIPALISSILAWLWLTNFPDAARETQVINGSTWFRWTYQPPIPPLAQAAWEGSISAFFEGSNRFNNALWTMRAEFIGSILIYGSYAILHGRQRTIAMIAGMISFGTMGVFFLVAFCGGALAYESRPHLRDNTIIGSAIGLVGLIIGATFPGHTAEPGIFSAVQSYLGRDGFQQAGALMLLISILMTPPFRRVFDLPFVQRLGELSFPIYLMHVPLIVGPACWAYTTFAPLSPVALAGLFLLVCLGTLVLAALFLVAVERPVLALLKNARTYGRARLAVHESRV